ncbi:MAG: CPBP family intramembrane glutamic endopeptidase [Hyphomicrobiales bacterium]
MTPGPSPAFAAIKSRYLFIGLVAVALIILIAYAIFIPFYDPVPTATVAEAVIGMALYVLIGAFLLLACWLAGVLGEVSLGGWPDRRQTWIYLSLGIPMIGIAMLGIYLLYLPLSYYAPDFVDAFVLEEIPLFLPGWDTRALTVNGINILAMVVVGPIVEEVLFRGFLFNRLWQKYSLKTAVIISSVAFALLHIEIIGGIVFGVVLALIYARTHSLIGPILIHMSNNALIAVLLLWDGAVTGTATGQTLAEFRGDWWMAALGAVIGVPWIAWYSWTYLRQPADPHPAAAETQPVEPE